MDNKTNIQTGLTNEEVTTRTIQGKINNCKDTASKSIKEIVGRNILTFFNMLNVCFLTLVLITGYLRNALFFCTVVVNTCIGIYQELRAKKTIEKMSLFHRHKACVLRNGEKLQIDKSEIVLDDICILKKGSQIPVDAVIVGENTIEVDESMLTGEADLVIKQEGDKIFSGSLVMSGQSKAQVSAVGNSAYINRLSLEAKSVKIKKSKLQRQINSLIKTVTLILIIVGPMSFMRQLTVVRFRHGIAWKQALLGSVTGVIGMVPEGLILLTTAALTLGVINLARRKVLTQELSAIETLARADVLCLDKTGTLTEGTLKVSEIVYYNHNHDYIGGIFAAIAAADEEQNSTVQAIGEAFLDIPDWRVINKIQFSSRTKWQAAEFEGHGTFILGAPDIILDNTDEAYTFCRESSKKGFRSLALLRSYEHIQTQQGQTQSDILPKSKDAEILAVILMSDQIRPSAAEVLTYFKNQSVDICVISGDHPETVKSICESVELPGSCIDMQELPSDPEILRETVKNNRIFGRVTPEQKKHIIKALQDNGRVVAMTGDGVNDILALKQADCGIAMASGSEAAQSAAQFVLLDSDFEALPQVVAQGRRVINNINRVASLFLIKTVWSILLSLILSVRALPYPFSPIKMSLVSFLVIGLPSFLLALEANYDIVKGDFIKKTLLNALPAGTVVFMCLYFISGDMLSDGKPVSYAATIGIIAAVCVHLWTLFLICQPMTLWRKTVFALLIFTGLAIMMIQPLVRFFGFESVGPDYYVYTLAVCGAGIVLTTFFRILLRRFVRV